MSLSSGPDEGSYYHVYFRKNFPELAKRVTKQSALNAAANRSPSTANTPGTAVSATHAKGMTVLPPSSSAGGTAISPNTAWAMGIQWQLGPGNGPSERRRYLSLPSLTMKPPVTMKMSASMTTRGDETTTALQQQTGRSSPGQQQRSLRSSSLPLNVYGSFPQNGPFGLVPHSKAVPRHDHCLGNHGLQSYAAVTAADLSLRPSASFSFPQPLAPPLPLPSLPGLSTLTTMGMNSSNVGGEGTADGAPITSTQQVLQSRPDPRAAAVAANAASSSIYSQGQMSSLDHVDTRRLSW